MECPRCGSENVTHSHRRGIEKLLRFFLPRVPYRCKECWSRFWKFHNPFQTMSSKIIVGASLLCLTVVVIVLVLSNGDKTEDTRTAKWPKKPVAVSTFDTMKTPSDNIVPEKTPPELKPEGSGSTPPLIAAEKSATPPEVKKVAGEGGKKPMADTKEADVKLAAWEAGSKTAKKPDHTETARPTPVKPTKPDTKTTVANSETRTLKGVRQVDVDGEFGVIVTADGPIKNFTQHFIKDESPPKFYIDLPGKWHKKVKDRGVESDMIYKIRFGKHDDYLRIVFDLKKLPVFPDVKESGEGMIILLRKNK